MMGLCVAHGTVPLSNPTAWVPSWRCCGNRQWCQSATTSSCIAFISPQPCCIFHCRAHGLGWLWGLAVLCVLGLQEGDKGHIP